MAQRPPGQGHRQTVVDPGGPGIPGGTVRRDAKHPTAFGGDPRKQGPYIDPKIADPAALQYAMGAATRRRTPFAIPKNAEPVAGGPDVLIPRLDGEVTPGLSMVEQARLQRGLPQDGSLDRASPQAPDIAGLVGGMASQPAMRRGIIEGNSHQQQEAASAPRNTQNELLSGLTQTDTLPPEATSDPAFQSGHGAMFAVNQPHLARKYGVIRNGQRVPPTMLQEQVRKVQQVRSSGTPVGQNSPIKPETIAGLQALEDFNKTRASAEADDSDKNIQRAALNGPAGGVGATEPPLTEQERKAILEDMDDFDVSRARNALFKDLLNNDKQREIIESRLTPLKLSELIMQGVVKQRVPVIPGEFEPVFQSYSGEEDLWTKRLIGDEIRSNGTSGSDTYTLDKFLLMGLTISLHAINKQMLPDYRGSDGEFKEEAFWHKYKIVSKFNYHMLASLAANWFWFDVRVRKLYKAEDLGNG